MLDVTKKYLTPVDREKIECRICNVSHICIPHALTGSELENLDDICIAKRRIEPGDALFHESEKQTRIHAVRTGSFKTYVTNSEGMEQITGFYLPGDIIGLDGLGGGICQSTAVAIETSTSCEIPEAEFSRLCEHNSELNNSFMRILSKEILREQQHMMALGQMSAEARVAGFIINLSNRFRERGFSATEFNLNMSRHDIANYLALAAETLSRILSKFQDDGHIDVQRRNIKVLDMDEGHGRANGKRCARKSS